jgi:hypothetical protein
MPETVVLLRPSARRQLNSRSEWAHQCTRVVGGTVDRASHPPQAGPLGSFPGFLPSMIALALLCAVGLAHRADAHGSVGLGAARHTAASALRTRLEIFRPFSSSDQLRPEYSVAGRWHGECGPSMVSFRSDAARCVTNSFVVDPCFVDASRRMAACPSPPRALSSYPRSLPPRTVEVIRFRHHRSEDFGSGRVAWAISLANGENCWSTRGMGRSPRHGRSSYFACMSGSTAGRAHVKGGTWTIRYGRGANPRRLTWERIRVAYL